MIRTGVMACACALALAGAAVADPQSQSAAYSAPAGVAALNDAELADLHAGQAPIVTMLTTQQLTATNTGNTINALGGVGSGSIAFDANAFSGFSGLGNFVVNTGHNNNLQGSLSLSIVLPPSP